MKIEVSLFMDFAKYLPPEASKGKVTISLDEGATVKDLLTFFGISLSEEKVVEINGVSQGGADNVNSLELKEGDVVAIFPPLGGG